MLRMVMNVLIKILLDEVFGEDNFRNEITWVRTASHNDSKQNYSRVKDSIFFYSRSEEYRPCTFSFLWT